MATNIEIGGISNFDPTGDSTTCATRWRRWKRSFELFVTGKGVKDDKQKRCLLLHCAGMAVQDIFDTLTETGTDYKTALEKLDEYFSPQVNIPYERYMFRQIRQEEGESVDQFITRCKQKAACCDFGGSMNEHIRDHVIDKCRQSSLRRKLLENCKDLTLSKLAETARAFESVQSQAAEMEAGASYSKETVNKVGSNRQKYSRQNKRDDKKKNAKCYKCGRHGHISTDKSCPAIGQTCNKCGGADHFAVTCKTDTEKQNTSGNRKQGKKWQKRVNFMADDTDSDEFAFRVKEDIVSDGTMCFSVGSVPIDMLIDSGASCNVVDRPTWENLKRQKIKCKHTEKCEKKVYAYGSGNSLQVAGKFIADIATSRNAVEAEFIVVEGQGEPLLGRTTAMQLGVLKIGPEVKAVKSDLDILSEFKSCFEGVGKLKGYEAKIHIDENVQPVAQPMRRIPFHLRDKVDAKLKELEDMDIIEKVDGPSHWVSPIVIVPKPSGEIRLCVDMRRANEAVIRARHPIPTVEEVLHNMNGSKVFSKLDLKWGYHQIVLEEGSRDITTFATHRGLYRYKRLMFGISSASELYQDVIQQLLQGCEGAQNLSDDIVIDAPNTREHDRRLHKVLERLSEKGVTLNPDKCEFRMSELTFMGNRLSAKGVGPTRAKVEAVANARRPETASEVRSFLGLVNFSARFIPDIATVSEPLRLLTRKNAPFQWGRKEQNAFETLKQRLSEAKTLAYYDRDAKTCVIADASPVGLGAVLYQVTKDGDHQVVSYASRSLSDVEKRYSQTEKEALALVWACERFHLYIYGTDFDLLTDHKPLEMIYSKHSKPSARIERWVLRMQPYSFTVRYTPGKTNIADALSRLTQITQTSVPAKRNVAEEYIRFAAENSVPASMCARDVERESAMDEELAEVRDSIKSGDWTSRGVQSYRTVRNELTLVGKLVLRGTRMVIPRRLRRQVLKLAHEGHQGIVKTKMRLRTNVWWPGMDREAENLCKSCHPCQLVSQPLPPEPTERTTFPSGPWEDLSLDLMGPLPSGDHIMVLVDYYSRYFDVAIIKSTTSTNLIEHLDRMFAIYGLPISITSDNGANLVSREFENYMAENGILHRKVTPLWPQANGEVERQNRTILKTLRIAQAEHRDWKKELNKFLMAHRTTPHIVTGVSPAELLFGRKLRTKLPELKTDHRKSDAEVRDRDAERKMAGKDYADQRRRATERDLAIGDTVLLQQQRENKLSTTYRDVPYTVRGKKGNQVIIEAPDGTSYCRNSSFVRKYCEAERDAEKDEMNKSTRENHVDEPRDPEVPPTPLRPSRAKNLPSRFSDFVME